MQVSRYRHGRRRWRVAAILMLGFAGLALAAQPVEFNATQRAPSVKTGAQLKTTLESYRSTMQRVAVATPFDSLRDKPAMRQRFDARWLLGRMVDAGAPLPELKEMGFEARDDGFYQIGTEQHPEWRFLDRQLIGYTRPAMLDLISNDLLARGFRREDLDAIGRFVAEHDLDRAEQVRKLEYVLSARKTVQKLQKMKKPLNDDLMLSFFYQRAYGIAEVEREWAQSLLDSLDPQRQRILISFCGEQPVQFLIGPTDTRAAMEHERELLLRPDIEQLARAAFQEGKL